MNTSWIGTNSAPLHVVQNAVIGALSDAPIGEPAMDLVVERCPESGDGLIDLECCSCNTESCGSCGSCGASCFSCCNSSETYCSCSCSSSCNSCSCSSCYSCYC
jgi:hypothetical protein